MHIFLLLSWTDTKKHMCLYAIGRISIPLFQNNFDIKVISITKLNHVDIWDGDIYVMNFSHFMKITESKNYYSLVPENRK